MITFFECGQGDSAYIKELNLLVDLGDKTSNNSKISGKVDLMISHSHDDCFFAIVFPENLQQNSNKFADGIPWNLHLQIYDFIGRSSMHA